MRIHHLKNRLEHITVVDTLPGDRSQVFFGAWVGLRTKKEVSASIASLDLMSFDSAKGLISMDSPMAKALMKKAQGDEVVVKRPKGDTLFTIVRVQYEPFKDANKNE